MSTDKENREDEALHIGGVVSSYLIRFNEVDEQGNIFLPNSINLDNLNQMKISGQIKAFEVDENGVKVIKVYI